MKTIEQIQEKLYLMQEKSLRINHETDEHYKRIALLQYDMKMLQSEIDTLLLDIKYDFELEQFLAVR